MDTTLEEVVVSTDQTNTNNNNNNELETSRKNLQDALAGLNLQFADDDKSDNDSDQKSELLIGATQTVISFVFFNKQPTLFNLLIQMLTTNTFHPASLSSNLPFQPSPTPITIKQQEKEKESLNGSSNSAFSINSTTAAADPKKSSMMFNILHEAINVVSQQFQKNFYLYILEKPDPQTSTPQQLLDYDSLVAGCLAFINHMMSAAPTFFDFERYRQLLSSQGVNDIIKTFIKSVHPNTRSELLHFQKHKTNSIKIAKQQDDKSNITSFFSRLLKMSFPNSMTAINNSGQEEMSDQQKLKALGFESSEPFDELLSTGILGLRNLIYFSARYSRIYTEILDAQSNPQNSNPYSFIRVGMHLTNVLYEIYIEDENIYEIIFDQDDWFEELFCITFELFDEIWEREGKAEEDFIPVLVKTRTILSRLKWTNPESIESFQVTLGNVLDEMWSKIENIKEEKEMSARVGGLSDSIIGLPYISGGSNNNNSSHSNSSSSGGMNSPTYRFQKLLFEKFKTHRKSTEFPVFLDDTSSVNSDTKSSSSVTKEVVHRDKEKDGSLHRIHTKSLSFKKLFSDLKSDHNNSSAERKLSTSSTISIDQLSSAENLPNNNPLSSSSNNISKDTELNNSDTHSQSSQTAGDQDPTKLEKLGSMAKKLYKNVKAKATNISSSSGSTSSNNNNIETSNESNILTTSNNSNIDQQQQQQQQQAINISNESNNDTSKFGSIKSSGSYIYNTVKKATVKMAKKGKKTITKRVKRKKEKNSSANSSNSGSLNNSNVNVNSGNGKDAISIYANDDHEFKPSLDLDFDRNSDDSSYEYTDEEIEVDDDTNTQYSMESSSDAGNKLIKSRSVDILAGNGNNSSGISNNNPIVIIDQSPLKPIDSTISTPTIPKTNNTESNSTPGISSSTSQEVLATHPPLISINSRTESEQSLTDAASLHISVLNKQKQQKPSAVKQQLSSGENSPRSNNPSPNGSPKVSRAHTLDLKRPVLSRAPIPASFISNNGTTTTTNTTTTTTQPPIISKSPSIKSLVNFFEVKSTKDGQPPTLQKERSFKSNLTGNDLSSDDNNSKYSNN